MTLGTWQEIEMKRFLNRKKKLIEVGLTENEAETMAEILLNRDRDSGDDRKLCLECASWAKRCTTPKRGYCTVPTMLQRCDGFTARSA
jgi:hypothetical protein